MLRVAQEALHNALRHAAAERVAVRLARDGGALVLEVSDDGVGFEPADPELRSRRLGLTSMHERAQRLGARLAVRSGPGQGTTVRLEVAA
jgi:signal transduction histidine kinase